MLPSLHAGCPSGKLDGTMPLSKACSMAWYSSQDVTALGDGTWHNDGINTNSISQ